MHCAFLTLYYIVTDKPLGLQIDVCLTLSHYTRPDRRLYANFSSSRNFSLSLSISDNIMNQSCLILSRSGSCEVDTAVSTF